MKTQQSNGGGGAKKTVTYNEQLQDEKWDGYDHLMKSKPTHRNKFDPKVSIYDLNSMRDSVFFQEKERFSFCLSPPKEKPDQFKEHLNNKSKGTDDLDDLPSLKDYIKNGKENQTDNITPKHQLQHQQQQPLKKLKTELPPSQQSQQNHQYNSRKVIVTKPQPQVQPIPVQNSNLSKIPSSPTKRKSSIGNLNPPVINEQSNTINSTLINNNPQSKLQVRPPTPTKQLMSNRPASPIPGNQQTNTSSSTSSYNNTTSNSFVQRPQTPTKQTNKPMTTNTTNNVVVESNRPQYHTGEDPLLVLEAKMESRMKSIELENRLLRQQSIEKDHSISQLTQRVSELEYQLATFMMEMKSLISSSSSSKK
ncbi:hypothetical protein DLAC_07923 [Tieghemostelium lacteum]|uniref:Uncharacterized protein n=1 Tax=Tieghemostelium lacteum TaxID=361077 RepID=A0A151ZAV5_TIELA|nr:hypothetical protein DLAC_07923 [Tieghemostelium lacteum]|eukprot:KYQ91024.1 hypothetical protein DLAC_07923 [Tieghemostelium lacteum]